MQWSDLVAHHVLSGFGWLLFACRAHCCGARRHDRDSGMYSAFLILMGFTTPLSSSMFHNIVPSPFSCTTPPNPLTIFTFTVVMVPMKWLDRLELSVEAWLKMLMVKESESTEKFWGLQQRLELLCGDSEGRAVLITLGHLLSIRILCLLLFRLIYLLQLCLRLCLSICLGLCCPEVRWWSVSDLILNLIHSIIVIIDLIPRFHHLYLLQTFLAPSETTITAIVAPIIITMMLMESDARNNGRCWALEMLSLSMKTLNLSHFPQLQVAHHLFSSLLIYKRMWIRRCPEAWCPGTVSWKYVMSFPPLWDCIIRVDRWFTPSALDTKSKSYHLISWCWPLHILVRAFSTTLHLFQFGTIFQFVSYPGVCLCLWPCLCLCLCLFPFMEVMTWNSWRALGCCLWVSTLCRTGLRYALAQETWNSNFFPSSVSQTFSGRR